MNLKNYYLNLEKLSDLDENVQIRIHEYYRDMIYSKQDKRDDIAESIFNTLWHSGYLKDIREEKLDSILDEDKSINS